MRVIPVSSISISEAARMLGFSSKTIFSVSSAASVMRISRVNGVSIKCDTMFRESSPVSEISVCTAKRASNTSPRWVMVAAV